MKRRKFIFSAASAIPAITLFPADLSGMTRARVRGKLEKRSLGKTGEMLSVIGFSAHSVEAAMALMERFDFDTILFPFNYATWNAGNFGPQVMAMAKEKNMGILALKAMAKGPWPEGADRSVYPKCWYEPLVSEEDITMGLRFTLSHPVTAAIPPGDERLFRQALTLTHNLKPLDHSEVISIREKALKGVPLFKS
jgi:predicted aldo/keto reductase-like oxidoreductase